MLPVTAKAAATKRIVKKVNVRKAVVKPVPKKAVIKPVPKKPVIKPAPKKVVPKVVTKKVVKKVTPKPVVKKVVKKVVVKKKAPVPIKKAAPPPKRPPVVRKKVSKVGAKDAGPNLAKWYGPNRSLFLPPGLFGQNEVPKYLTGDLPGDYGYDPLGIGQSTAKVAEYREYELIHARWAMLGAAGMIIPEGLAANGADLKGAAWFDAGKEMLGGGTLKYFAVPFGIVNNPLPLLAIFAVEVALMFQVETYRSTGEGPPGYAPGIGDFDSSAFNGLDRLYPGGPLDPFNFASDPEVFQELKVKEIKNGRLAMMATLGFAVQAAVTGEGPYANWSKHVADPFGYNLLTVLGDERVPNL